MIRLALSVCSTQSRFIQIAFFLPKVGIKDEYILWIEVDWDDREIEQLPHSKMESVLNARMLQVVPQIDCSRQARL
jgi:hypothetical protein